MSTLIEELSARVKALSVEDRARLAEELLDSLHGQSDAEAVQPDAWRQQQKRQSQTHNED